MDKERFDRGLARRKATLGDDYVTKNLAAADDFSRPFQEMMTEWCWGFGWGDDAIDVKTRSLMNLAMIGALGKMHEWEIHCRGALNNGVTKEADPRRHPHRRHILRRAPVPRMLPGGATSPRRSRRALAVEADFGMRRHHGGVALPGS